MDTLLKIAAPLILLAAHAAASATQPVLTLSDAQRVMAGALNYARSHSAPGAAVAIVDEGGSDGKTLYLTARSTLYRLPLLVEGTRP